MRFLNFERVFMLSGRRTGGNGNFYRRARNFWRRVKDTGLRPKSNDQRHPMASSGLRVKTGKFGGVLQRIVNSIKSLPTFEIERKRKKGYRERRERRAEHVGSKFLGTVIIRERFSKLRRPDLLIPVQYFKRPYTVNILNVRPPACFVRRL